MNKIALTIYKLPLYLFVLMLAGLLFSRALLSITTALWLIVIITSFSKEKLRLYKPILLWSLLPLGLFLLGFCQQPNAKENLDYLLTLLIYPVAAFSFASFEEVHDK